MELYSFLCQSIGWTNTYALVDVSVSLWSYIHSYFGNYSLVLGPEYKRFPSPYGVIFILM